MLAVLFIVVVIQLCYYFFFFSRLSDYVSKESTPDAWPPVSVVICAHDEMNRLKKNLPAILEQRYPQYEVIVVNDNSEDDSEMMLMRLQAQYPHLVVRDIRTSSHSMRGKKYPLTIGIRAAAHAIVLLTDADCAPSSEHWIRDMVKMFGAGKEIVLGYAPYKKERGLLNKFIRYETFITALQYFSFALAGKTYMGVGRNLAYHKRIFFEHNIYPKHPQLLSGDDDLLINAAATPENTAIQISGSSFMFSDAKHSWEEYWHQKQRHVSSARHYKFRDKFLLSLFSLSSIACYLLFLLTAVYSGFLIEACLLFALKMLIQGMVFRTTMSRLGEKDLWALFPLLDVLFLFYYLKIFPAVLQTKSASWK